MLRDLLVLHWGQVNQTLTIVDVDAASKTIAPVKGSSLEQEVSAEGKARSTSGSGKARRISGSGRIQRISGKGKIC